MFNVGGGELLVIFLLALLVLGPDKLPESARKVGRVLTELRRMSQGFQDEVRSAIDITDSANTTQTSPGPRLVGGTEKQATETSDGSGGDGAGGTNGTSAA